VWEVVVMMAVDWINGNKTSLVLSGQKYLVCIHYLYKYVLYCRFNQILCQRSFAHLRAVFDEYSKISKKTVEEAIKSEFSGDIKDGLLTVGKRMSLLFSSLEHLLCSADNVSAKLRRVMAHISLCLWLMRIICAVTQRSRWPCTVIK